MTETEKFSVVTPTEEDKRAHYLSIPIAACSEATTKIPGGCAPRRCTIWRGTVRNPSWGLLSLEQGTRIFLTGFGAVMAFVTFVIAMALLFQVIVLLSLSSGHDIKVPLRLPVSKQLNVGDVRRAYADAEEINGTINNINIAGTLFTLIVVITVGFLANSAWKCRKAMTTGAVHQMKDYFCILLIFIFIDVFVFCLPLPGLSKWVAMLVIPVFYVFNVLGLLFTYNYILSCEKAVRMRNQESVEQQF